MDVIRRIEKLSDLAPRYEALLCDAWGVIHNGVELFAGAGEALCAFREQYGPVIILTNAPRPSSIIPGQLDRLGLPREAYDAVVTSGDATRTAISDRLPAPAFRIGPEKDDPLFDGLEINFVDLESAQFIICTGLVDDQREHPDDYAPVLKKAAERDLVMICANPDIVVNWGGRIIWCAGALAEIYATLGGKVIFGGKPHAPIYELAERKVADILGRPVNREKLLAIGDGPATDIAGANRHEIDAIYVAGAGGIHEGETDEASIAARLSQHGAHAAGFMEALRW